MAPLFHAPYKYVRPFPKGIYVDLRGMSYLSGDTGISPFYNLPKYNDCVPETA